MYTRRTRVGAQKLRMHTLRPTTCSTVAPMAREGAGDIPDNDTGQGINSSSTYTHVQGAYGAPTGAVGGAAVGRRNALCGSSISRTGDSNAIKTIYEHSVMDGY